LIQRKDIFHISLKRY